MRFIALAASSAAAAGLAAAAPFSFPLPNGFPNLNATALQAVYKQAGGTLPNGALPSSLKASGIQALQLLAANELFEVAYFTELYNNLTTGADGYKGRSQYDINTIRAIRAQEEVHVLAVNGVLANANATTIQPCQYNFPVTNFDDAILLAQTFTDVGLGVLPVAQTIFAQDGGQETALISIVGSIIAQEGQQSGWYRSLQEKYASAAPILTGGAPQFAFSAISQFIVPGSCPNIQAIGLAAFPALAIESGNPTNKNGTYVFSVPGTNVTAASASLAYISGANTPVSVPIRNVYTQGGRSYFTAAFPYESGFARGLTLGALVRGANATFANVSQVAAATSNGPVLIEVD